MKIELQGVTTSILMRVTGVVRIKLKKLALYYSIELLIYSRVMKKYGLYREVLNVPCLATFFLQAALGHLLLVQ